MPSADQREFLVRTRAYISLTEAGGVPGPVMIAQAAIESGWGRSGLARLGNALFAVKARAGWTGKVYSGTTREWIPERGHITIPGTNRIYASYGQAIANGCRPESLFRAYDTLDENVSDYLQFFRKNPRYHAALAGYAHTRDSCRFARDIARAGYATNPLYGRLLVAFMERLTPDLLPPRPLSLHVRGAAIPQTALMVVNGRLFVHIRQLAAALGSSLRYDPMSKTVYVEEGKR